MILLADWRRALCPGRRGVDDNNKLVEELNCEDDEELVEVVEEAAKEEAAAAETMPRGLPGRRGLQALVLVLATAYATVLLYQAVAPRQVRLIGYFLLVVVVFFFSHTNNSH